MNKLLSDVQIGFVGCGQMACALAQGLVEGGLVAGGQVWGLDPSDAALEQFRATVPEVGIVSQPSEMVGNCQVVILAVKPQHVSTAAGQLRPFLSERHLVVSIAAGVTLARLHAELEIERLVRVMPNTPALVGLGASGYALGRGATAEDGRLVEQLLGSVGIAFQLEESLLDAVTGVSGSGPAYVALMIEALSDGGVRMGLPRDVATALAAQTLRGSAEMVLRGEHPAILKDRVASPSGTTIVALETLEERALRGALIAAVRAATNRSRELNQS